MLIGDSSDPLLPKCAAANGVHVHHLTEPGGSEQKPPAIDLVKMIKSIPEPAVVEIASETVPGPEAPPVEPEILPPKPLRPPIIDANNDLLEIRKLFATSAVPAPAAAPAPTIGTKSVERLLRSLLRRPRSEAEMRLALEVAEIPERKLEAAVTALGIQRQDGRWWLLG